MVKLSLLVAERVTYVFIANHVLWTVTTRSVLMAILPDQVVVACSWACCQTRFSEHQIVRASDARWTAFVTVAMELSTDACAKSAREHDAANSQAKQHVYHVEH